MEKAGDSEIMKREFYHLVRFGISEANLGVDPDPVTPYVNLGDSFAPFEAVSFTLNLG